MNLEKVIKDSIINFDGKVAVYYDDLKGNILKINEKEKYNSASCIKIFILIELFNQINNEMINRKTELTYLDKHYVNGSGVMRYLSKGIKLPVIDIATLMMIISDNVATNILIDFLGIDKINKTIENIGCKDTKLYSEFKSVEDEVFSEITAYDYYLVWKKLNDYELFDKDITQEIIDIIKNQKYHEMVGDGIDEIYKEVEKPIVNYIVTKSGKYQFVRNDGGIVSTKYGNYILTIFIKDFKDKDYRNDEYVYNQGKKISNIIFNEFIRGSNLMKFEISVIDNALKYYKINDIDYRNKCYKCIRDVNEIEDFNIKAEEIYNILYTNKSFKIDTLWKRQNMIELFGELYNPYITNILVLYGYEIHCKNMKLKKYNKEQKELYKKRVKETLTNDIFFRKLESIRISQMIWATYFINTKLIEVGRLQYEKCERYIKIHIPSGEKLQIDKVLDSIKNSRQEIEKYFNIKEAEYRCDSWLLSNQINDIIDKDSNIAKFYNLFEVKDGLDATKDILNFVFNVQECSNYNDLVEDTSLQKLLKLQLLKNKEMKMGWGKLKI